MKKSTKNDSKAALCLKYSILLFSLVAIANFSGERLTAQKDRSADNQLVDRVKRQVESFNNSEQPFTYRRTKEIISKNSSGENVGADHKYIFVKIQPPYLTAVIKSKVTSLGEYKNEHEIKLIGRKEGPYWMKRPDESWEKNIRGKGGSVSPKTLIEMRPDWKPDLSNFLRYISEIRTTTNGNNDTSSSTKTYQIHRDPEKLNRHQPPEVVASNLPGKGMYLNSSVEVTINTETEEMIRFQVIENIKRTIKVSAPSGSENNTGELTRTAAIRVETAVSNIGETTVDKTDKTTYHRLTGEREKERNE